METPDICGDGLAGNLKGAEKSVLIRRKMVLIRCAYTAFLLTFEFEWRLQTSPEGFGIKSALATLKPGKRHFSTKFPYKE
jgi:hypothetical protein